MRGKLFVSILSIASSYARNFERPVAEGDIPDTLQWWVAETGTWRIRTYALDHDIHTHSLGVRSDPLGLVLSNTEKHFGNIISAQHVFDLDDAEDLGAAHAILLSAGLAPYLEVAAPHFVFWTPDSARYFSQTNPD